MSTATFLGLSLTLSPPALTALRIAPLLSSTASLTHAYMEWLTNSAFLFPAPVESKITLLLLGEGTPIAVAPSALQDADEEERRNTLEKGKQLVIPEWFTNFFNTGVISVIGLNTLTLLSATVNLALPEGLAESKVFYQVGLAAAVGHYAFVPLVGRSVRALLGLAASRAKKEGGEGKGEEGRAIEWVSEWVRCHKIRMCSVDVLAWACFLWGGVHAVTTKA